MHLHLPSCLLLHLPHHLTSFLRVCLSVTLTLTVTSNAATLLLHATAAQTTTPRTLFRHLWIWFVAVDYARTGFPSTSPDRLR